MKFLLSFLLFSFPLIGAIGQQDEIDLLRELIDTTKNNLDLQQELLRRVIEFKQARAAFSAEPTSTALAAKLVKSAMTLQKNLENSHLEHLFSSDLLTELAFFNQVGMKQLTRER